MEEELNKSYIELLDRIKADARGKETILPDLFAYFLPTSKQNKYSITKKILKLSFFSPKSKLKSIDDLLHELEANNIICKNNVTPLDLIVDKLDNDILKHFLTKHKEFITKSESLIVPAEDQPVVGLSVKVREAVCQGISKRWVDLGRHLYLTDETLDQIERKHQDFCQRAAKVLDCFEAGVTPAEDRGTVLLKALIAAKRKDLADKIKPMLEETGSH